MAVSIYVLGTVFSPLHVLGLHNALWRTATNTVSKVKYPLPLGYQELTGLSVSGLGSANFPSSFTIEFFRMHYEYCGLPGYLQRMASLWVYPSFKL